MTTGLVLSGGGARGDFQVGAVRYLYERNIKPTVIAGTSVGAINAIKLAEGEGDGNDPTRGLKGLTGIWRELQTSADMWKEEDWLVNVQNSEIVKFLKQSALKQIGTVGVEVAKLGLGPIGWAWVAYDIAQVVDDIEELKRELGKVVNAQSRSIYNLGPIQAKLNDPAKLDLNKVRQSNIKLRLGVVALESGQLRYMTEAGKLLERGSASFTQSSPSLAPQCSSIAATIKNLELFRNNLQEELRHAATGDKAALVAQIRDLNKQISHQKGLLTSCNISYPPQTTPLTVSMVQGTLASASIPLAFPPVKLGGENYVDGGVREIVPIQAAIEAGATEIFAVLASDSKMDPARSALGGHLLPSFDQGVANVGDVVNRATSDIMSNETVLNEVEPHNGWGANVKVTIIQPDNDIHDIMTIDPGLIDIRMAHGYMRADDTYQAKQSNPAGYRELAEQYSRDRNTILIYETRHAIWKLEYAANGYQLNYDSSGRPIHPAPRIEASLQAMREVRALKNTLRDLVQERKQKGGLVPSEADSWWLSWERHPWTTDRRLWLPTGPAAEGGDMQPGEILAFEKGIHSPNGQYSFVFQGDGNLVLYKITKTQGAPAAQCRAISDEIAGLQNNIATLQAQLKLAAPREKAELLAEIRELNSLVTERKQALSACNITYPPQTVTQRSAVWATGTGAPAGVCVLQGDGNLVIYDEGSRVRWSSNTWQHPGSRLVLQDDGNVVIYRPDGRAVWSIK
ncbi:patatin-like phospholipase family protein [Paenibacillus sp. GCM10027627]|uniref:patatin-like phospholipase family protein n=1 Tax=unclassified Paenibacillus TaxID=185978 RepID=UPI0036258509